MLVNTYQIDSSTNICGVCGALVLIEDTDNHEAFHAAYNQHHVHCQIMHGGSCSCGIAGLRVMIGMAHRVVPPHP